MRRRRSGAKARAVRPNLIWIETPANPTWDVTDIAAACAIAREVGAIVAVDSTAATPMLTRPLELGAHVVMHSATKYLNGHSDVIAGVLAVPARRAVAANPLHSRRRRRRAGPLEAWLLLRGMRTLALRVAAASANAAAIAARFHGHAGSRTCSIPDCRRTRTTPSRPRRCVAASAA
jgi:cystathionine gamma-synthase